MMTEVEAKPVVTPAQPTKAARFGDVMRRDQQKVEGLARSDRWTVTAAIAFACALLVTGIVLLIRN